MTRVRHLKSMLRYGTAAVLALVLCTSPAFVQAASPKSGGAETHGQESARKAAEAFRKIMSGGGDTDESTVLSAPAPNAHRLYVIDPHSLMPNSRQFAVDGDSARVVGTFDGGYLPQALSASDGSFFVKNDTYWSRGARGKRTDVVEIYDPKTFDLIGDIELPDTTRFLTVLTMPWLNALTPDDKKLYYYQFAPTPGVGVVDLEGRKFERMIEVPDCYHIFPSGNDRFYMHCRDGSLLNVKVGADGKVETTTTAGFRGDDDHLFNGPTYSPKNGRLIWPSFGGKIFQADLSGDEARILPVIDPFTAEEKAAGWMPGGNQTTAYHRASDRIFLLADQRRESTHRLPSRFVFVIDGKTGKRLNTFDLGHAVNAIAVSQDDNPQLYALSSGDQTLYILDPETGKQTAAVKELGMTPQLLTLAEQ